MAIKMGEVQFGRGCIAIGVPNQTMPIRGSAREGGAVPEPARIKIERARALGVREQQVLSIGRDDRLPEVGATKREESLREALRIASSAYRLFESGTSRAKPWPSKGDPPPYDETAIKPEHRERLATIGHQACVRGNSTSGAPNSMRWRRL